MSLLFEPMTSWSIGSAHALGDPAGEDVAEVAGRHRERSSGPAARRSGHVVDDLGHHPGPVDRVHGRQPHARSRNALVGEQRLHEVLAVVEGALDGDVVDVGRVDRGHLAALHVAHPAGRVEHDDVEVRPADAGLDGGRAGVARGGDDDRGPLAAAGELVVEQPADELERDVLEGQRRAPEELEQVEVVELRRPGTRRGGRRWRRRRRPSPRSRRVDRAVDEGPHHVDGDVGVGRSSDQTSEAGAATSRGRRARRRRPGRSSSDVAEAEHRRGAAGGDVLHMRRRRDHAERRSRCGRPRRGRARSCEGGLHVGLAGAVGDEDEAGLVAEPLLLHRADRHVVVAEHAGDLRRARRAGRAPRGSGSRRTRRRRSGGCTALPSVPDRRVRALVQVDGGVDEVAEDGAGRRRARRRRGRRT